MGQLQARKTFWVRLLPALTLFLDASCSSTPSGTDTLFSNDQQNIPSHTYFAATFTLPEPAEVSYAVVDQGSKDTWSVGIFTPSDWASYQQGQMVSAQAAHNGVSTISDEASLAEGDWVLGIWCDNVLEHCPFELTVSAAF